MVVENNTNDHMSSIAVPGTWYWYMIYNMVPGTRHDLVAVGQ